EARTFYGQKIDRHRVARFRFAKVAIKKVFVILLTRFPPLLESMSLHLCPVAAIPHVTPSAAVIFSRVDEEPAAIVTAAAMHMAQLAMRYHQVGGRARHRA